MTVSNTAAAAEQAAANSSGALEVQTRAFFTDSSLWVQTHWLQILIAAGIAAGIFFLLHGLRRWG
jgi:MFS superfamily sulfate permease-like transporter